MPERRSRDIERTAAATAQLARMQREQAGVRARRGDGMPSARSTESKPPMDLGAVSVLGQNLREIREQLAAYRTAAEPIDAPGSAQAAPECMDVHDGYRGLAERYKAASTEMARATDELMREQLARTVCQIAMRNGTPPRPCPMLHTNGKLPRHRAGMVPDAGPAAPKYVGYSVPANTVVPEHLIGGPTGSAVCLHSDCYIDGEPRRFRYLGDLLPVDPDAVYSGELLALLLGMKYKTLMSYLKEAAVPVAGVEYTGANPRNQYRLHEALRVPRIVRRLAGPAF